ncbi:MAG: glucosaminidase domain-containing protein [Campylobacterota bacterium]|nr:glucosaminidase domain-containing protein [Campylobacterota bacterium]
MKYIYKSILVIAIISLFTACDKSKVKVIKNNPLDTKIGTIVNQKLITKVKVKKVIPKKIIKKIIKKVPLSVQEKKQNFKEIMVPISKLVYKKLEDQYQDIKKNMLENKNREFIELLKKEYKAKSDEELLQALKPHPISIVLAQAAIESAWLTSRFTREANNIFGVWSFNKNEPRIAASGMRGDKTIYLKKYKNYKSAVEDYYKNLGKNWAYKEFRKQRIITSDPYELVLHLESYSEKKEAYTLMLQKVIRYNKFDSFDLNSSF